MKRKKCMQRSNDNKQAGWHCLTWDDLEHWAGSRSVSRGRSYQQQGRVENLAISEDGRLLATVHGGDSYIVSVRQVAEKKAKRDSLLESQCTCPVGSNGCKHAVAVVAAYLQAMAEDKKVAIAKPNDPRWFQLDGSREAQDDFEDDEEAYNERSSRASDKHRTNAKCDEKIRQYISSKDPDELTELLYALTQRYPELREEFCERIALGEGDVKRLLAQAKSEIHTLTSQHGWRNSWTGEGYTPDYSRLQHRFERLVELGHCDAVVKLGREFLGCVMDQVGQSDDEGETAMAAADCLPVVFDAVIKSSLSAPQKILFAIDACMKDDYDVLGDEIGVIFDAKWRPCDWSAVADELKSRLQNKSPANDDRSPNSYSRDCLTNYLATALKNAGGNDEITAIYETEARATNSYERLVRHLLDRKRYEDAERWASEGIERTSEKLPGIASGLAAALCELAERRKKWDIVAAHSAWKFFAHPGTGAFVELVKKSTKAGCGEKVRNTVMRFLKTGIPPIRRNASNKDKPSLVIDPSWPLPVPDYIVPLMFRAIPGRLTGEPHYDVLLDMAIANKKPDDVLHWYDKIQAERKRRKNEWGWHSRSNEDAVAKAVAKTHPERALDIYQRKLDSFLPHAQISAYESAVIYLKNMRPIMKSLGREIQWKALLSEIRLKYGNRPRFMKILDNLEGHTIIETQKTRVQRR